MEQTFVHIATDAAWVFLVVFALAIVGVIAIVKWIIDLVTGAERAVVNEAHDIGNKLHGG